MNKHFIICMNIILLALGTSSIALAKPAKKTEACTVAAGDISDQTVKKFLGDNYRLLRKEETNVEENEVATIIAGHFRSLVKQDIAVVAKMPNYSSLLILTCNGDNLNFVQKFDFYHRKWALLFKKVAENGLDEINIIFTPPWSGDGGWVEWNSAKRVFEFKYLGD